LEIVPDLLVRVALLVLADFGKRMPELFGFKDGDTGAVPLGDAFVEYAFLGLLIRI
jgi:hypothetical protein